MIQFKNGLNTATNHRLTDTTVCWWSDVISHLLTHIPDLQYTQLPEIVNTVEVVIETGQMRGKSHRSVSFT